MLKPRSKDLYRMVYCSQMTTTGMLSMHTLKSIFEQSSHNNKHDVITGFLSYKDGYFFEYVEGDEQVLTNLKNRLVNDTRHRNMKIIDFSLIPSRHFSNWYMENVRLDNWGNDKEAMDKILPFNPMEWGNKEFNYFITLLKERYTQEANDYENYTQAPPFASFSQTLKITISEGIIRHQAFIVLLFVLGVMIFLATILILVVSHTK